MNGLPSCKVCGCTEIKACVDDLRGACWWVAERLCSHCAEPDARKSLAMVAIDRASLALVELVSFVNGNPGGSLGFAIEVDPIMQLAEALQRTAEIECAGTSHLEGVDREYLSQLIAALVRFQDGWAVR